MLAELGLAYETKPILPRTATMDEPDFRALSERNKIPLLEDGDLMIGESAAIILHLADRYREGAVLSPPAGSDDRARLEELCFFIMVEMDAVLYVLRKHEDLPDVYGEAPVACASAREYFLRSAAEMERRLTSGGPYLIGGSCSAADILLTSCLIWAGRSGIDLSPRLQDYSALVTARPAFSAAFAINFTPEAMAALSG